MDSNQFQFDQTLQSTYYAESDQIQLFSNKLQIGDWVRVNSVVKMSWSEWIGLDLLVKKAIVLEVNNSIEENNRRIETKEREMKMELAQAHTKLSFKDQSNSAVSHLMGR
jgi:hypothetical protein